MTYLESYWLGRGWVSISEAAQHRIAGSVWEIYDNAFTHAASTTGVFSCGQHYPRLKRLKLTVVDFGVGIPRRVSDFISLIEPDRSLLPRDCMEWAFKRGNSTKNTGASAGIGFDILRDLVRLNGGTLEVYSHSGHARIVKTGDFYTSRTKSFAGTVLNIVLNCDDSYYCLSSETVENDYF